MTIKTLVIEVEETSQEKQHNRLDLWLSQNLLELSRSRIQALIGQGQVQINQEICTSKKASVKKGDKISVTLPEAEPLELKAEEIPLDILYEDEFLIIINKPSGLVVHPAPGHWDKTLVNALLAHCPLAEIGGVQRPGIVHRLDKDTSGAIVIAKTDYAHQSLQTQLKEKTARREYLGIVYGCPKTEQGTINLPLGRHPIDRKKMAIVSEEKGGRIAITHWQIKERLGNYTLIHYQLETGRTHQIRVHSSYMGHPLVGDPVYSSGHSLGVNLSGQVLHAWKLSLNHPISGEFLQVVAPLPDDFLKLLEILRKRL